MKKVVLGQNAEDITTGFKGLVVGKCEYLSGCTQFAVRPKTEKGGKYPESSWIDEGKLKWIDGKEFTVEELTVKSNGADFSAPMA